MVIQRWHYSQPLGKVLDVRFYIMPARFADLEGEG